MPRVKEWTWGRSASRAVVIHFVSRAALLSRGVGVAAWSGSSLRSVEIDQHLGALRALTEHRDDLVRTRIQTINRLHTLLVKLAHPVYRAD
jgi:hypothetical protein